MKSFSFLKINIHEKYIRTEAYEGCRVKPSRNAKHTWKIFGIGGIGNVSEVKMIVSSPLHNIALVKQRFLRKQL